MKERGRGVFRTAISYGELHNTPYGLTPLVVLVAITLFGGLGQEFFTVAGPNIAQDLNLDLRAVGGILATVGIVALLGALFFGWLTDRVRRTWMYGIAIMAAGAFQMSLSATHGAGTYTASSSGQSLGVDAAQVPGRALMADYYPVEQRGRVFSLIGSLGQLTALFSLLVAGLLVTALGWRWTNVLLASPIFVLGVVVLIFLREPRRGYFEKKDLGFDDTTARREDPPQSYGEAWRTIWSVRLLRRFFLAQLVASIGFGADRFIAFLLADRYGLNALGRSLYAAPTLLAFLAGAVIGGGVLDSLGRSSPASTLRVIGAIGILPGLGYIVYALQPPLAVLLVTATITNFLGGMFVPAFQAVLSQVIPPKVRGQGFVLLSFSQIPARIALGVLFGPIAAAYGFRPMFLVAIPFIVVAAVLMVSVADYYEVDRRNAILSTAVDEEVRRAAEEGRTKVLICRGVNVFYEDNQVLFGVDFEVERGEIVALLGTNGAGKSTLLRAISGTQEASDGAIVLDARDITHMPPHEIAARGVVHMPGGRGVFPGLTVEENLKLATWLAGADHERELLNEAYDLFPALRERRMQRADLLSGGEQQMLSLAQAFMQRPKLLMIDELTLGLSPAVVGELIELVREINRRGVTVIVVEQSVNVALTIAERAVFMEKGEVKFAGATADLLRRPDILRAVYVKGTAGAGNGRARKGAAPSSRVMLDAAGIVKRYGGVTALDGVDLTLADEQILGLIGPNGSGKTTLFDVISGYQRPDTGTITFDGKDVTYLDAHERAALGLVRRFQDARLFPSLTVMESLLVALDHGIDNRSLAMATTALPASRRAERTARRRAESLIELLDLGAYRDKFVKELSTGLRRIVDLAWVLATEPKVLLLDEPSSGVAQSEAESLAPLLRRVRIETGCSILLVEHDIPLVSDLADELVAMAAGRVVVRGSASDVLEDDRVIEAFLGTSDEAVRRSGARR